MDRKVHLVADFRKTDYRKIFGVIINSAKMPYYHIDTEFLAA